jgi:hypothetical protein
MVIYSKQCGWLQCMLVVVEEIASCVAVMYFLHLFSHFFPMLSVAVSSSTHFGDRLVAGPLTLF